MITMEMIDQFRKRTNCSYEEAKMYLERNNGDIVDAIVDFEKNHGKVKYEAKSSKFKDFFSKAYRTRLVVENNNTVILNLSLLFVGLFVLFTLRSLPIIIISFVTALLLGYRFGIQKYTGSHVDINKFFNDASKSVHTYHQNHGPHQPESKSDQDNKPNEYTVE